MVKSRNVRRKLSDVKRQRKMSEFMTTVASDASIDKKAAVKAAAKVAKKKSTKADKRAAKATETAASTRPTGTALHWTCPDPGEDQITRICDAQPDGLECGVHVLSHARRKGVVSYCGHWRNQWSVDKANYWLRLRTMKLKKISRDATQTRCIILASHM